MRTASEIHVLFVCLGNICRSPMAEALFLQHLRLQGIADRFRVDSAGTGNWHVGELPDSRMRQTASRHGIELQSRARQILPEDLHHFQHVYCMDRSNLAHTLALGKGMARVELLRTYDPAGGTDVPDPYFGGLEGFETVYHLLDRTTGHLLAQLRTQYGF